MESMATTHSTSKAQQRWYPHMGAAAGKAFIEFQGELKDLHLLMVLISPPVLACLGPVAKPFFLRCVPVQRSRRPDRPGLLALPLMRASGT